jgi:hypothetical protein
MDWLLSRHMPPTFTDVTQGVGGEGSEVAPLPELRAPFAAAMSQATLLPAFVALFGVVAALFLVRFQRPQKKAPAPAALSGPSPESLDPIT